MIRPAGRSLATGALAAAVLIAALAFCRPTAPVPGAEGGDASRSGAAASTVTLVQMNVCLSGLAGCFDAGYPDIVDEAVSRILAAGPDAVTMTEACRLDAVQIARRTRYHVRFVPVVYAGAPLPCVDPRGRGLFGLAVLTRRPVVSSESDAFRAQAELEERRWLCVSTADGIEVCTAHLETPTSRATDATNDAQCAELGVVLTHRTSRFGLFGGDLNRRGSCAPPGAWSRTDAASERLPGIQHVYGSPAFEDPVAQVLPWPFSDHDLLVVSAHVVRRGGSSLPPGAPRRAAATSPTPARRPSPTRRGGRPETPRPRHFRGERLRRR